jgi:hypothetical protein
MEIAIVISASSGATYSTPLGGLGIDPHRFSKIRS